MTSHSTSPPELPVQDSVAELSSVELLAHGLKQRGLKLLTAESCTGGLLAGACTNVPGSSAWFERGWVTYSNASKTEMLGVPADVLQRFGAVSEAVARAMAQGAVQQMSHDSAGSVVGVAITGIAGPDGGSADKPMGTVWFACASARDVVAVCQHFSGDRPQVRAAAVQFACGYVRSFIHEKYAVL